MIHTNIADLGPVQRKLYRVLDSHAGALDWDALMRRMGGRSERAIIKLADRANRLHGHVFTCDAWGVRITRPLDG